MPSFPQFSAEENLNRIIMDKNTRYLLVEGPFDMPIYSEVVSLLVDKHQLQNKPVTVFGGGKRNILDWITTETPLNTAVILDMDFDDPDNELIDDIVTPLRRYSIENYFFDEAVISPLISHLLTRNNEDIQCALSIEELRAHWSTHLTELIPIMFYYQKRFIGDKNKWTTIFINRGQGDWRLCVDRIETVKLQLLTEMGVSYTDCKIDFDQVFGTAFCPSINFPGKILMESFYRYLKKLCNDEKKGAYSTITCTKSLVSQLASRLIRNDDFEQILLQAIA